MTQTDTQFETLQYERQDSIAIISVNNPPMNVINLKMGQEMDVLVEQIAADDSIRVVLFRSATPGVFIAGADITMIMDLDDEAMAEFKRIGSLFDRIAALPQPTVAAIGGTCLGGGFELALACDFRIMAEGFGEIGLPEVRLGLLPGGGGTQRLPRLVGAGVATEMLLKGMRYQAAKALELGLVHKVVATDDIDAEGLKYATSLAAQAPLALRALKRLVRAAFESPGPEALELERELFLELVQSNDSTEGINAFFENRKAVFNGN